LRVFDIRGIGVETKVCLLIDLLGRVRPLFVRWLTSRHGVISGECLGKKPPARKIEKKE